MCGHGGKSIKTALMVLKLKLSQPLKFEVNTKHTTNTFSILTSKS